MILGSFWWTFVVAVLALAVGAAVIVTAGVLSFYVGADLYRWLRARVPGWREYRRLLRESRQLRRLELTSEDFDDWCEVRDDETDA